MSVENEVQQLRERVSELERRIDQLFAHVGVKSDPMPGSKAATISPKVRSLIADSRIIDAMAAYSRESDGARDLSNVDIARVYQEETGQPFDPKRAR
jgi:hypothetical protein